MWKLTQIGLNNEGNLWIKNYQICIRETPPQFSSNFLDSILCVLASIITVDPSLINTFRIWSHSISYMLMSALFIPRSKNAWVGNGLTGWHNGFKFPETTQNSIWSQKYWRMNGGKAKTSVQRWHGLAVETFSGTEDGVLLSFFTLPPPHSSSHSSISFM